MDLFKKKSKTQAAPTKQVAPKKSLFAKKTKAEPSSESAPVLKDKAPKKSLFAKKTTAKQDKVVVKPKLGNKNLPILIATVLGLVVLALAAKFFLFTDEPEVAPESPAVIAPEPVQETQTPQVQEAETQETPKEAINQETPAETPVSSSETVATEIITTDSSKAVSDEPKTEEKISYDEFVKQSQSRVYRERSTSPSEATQ